jgi:parallel beta-helix repeat protein
VENVEVIGASDAGIYVGQCTRAIVRSNIVRGNVIGIEVENTTEADVYDNTIEDNSLGVLAIILPNLEKKDGGKVLIRDNRISGNDRENFAVPDTTAGSIPPGAGILLMAMKDVEIRDNMIGDQSGPGIFIASYEVFELLSLMFSNDDETDKWPERVYVHGNTIEDTGAEPMGDWALLELDPFPPVFWDGVLAPGVDTQAAMEICLGDEEQMSFIKIGTGSIDDLFLVEEQTDDVTDHMCTIDPLPELEDE